MTITKLSENYNLNDSLENGWNVSGNMSVSENETSVNLQIYGTSGDSTMMGGEIGNYYWRESDRLYISYSVNKNVDTADFEKICKEAVEEALSHK